MAGTPLSAPVAQVLGSISSYGLTRARSRVDLSALADETWSQVTSAVSHQRLTGLMWKMAVDQASDLAQERLDEARRMQESAMVLSVQLELELLRIAQMLDSEGIDHRVLKGPAFARMHYGDPSLRPFGDIDLMIRADQIDAAIALLELAGGSRRFAEPRPGFIARFGKGACVALDGGAEVDLHRTLSIGPFGILFDPQVMFERRSLFAVGGRLLAAPDVEARFIHACYHAVLGGPVPRLLSLRDVLQIVDRCTLDLGRIEQVVVPVGGSIVVATALQLAADTLDVPLDAEIASWSDSLAPSPGDRRRLDLYMGGRRSSARLTLASLGAMRRPSDRLTYLRAVLFPTASRHGSLVERWSAGLRSVRASMGSR